MKPELRIVTKLPLSELWDETGPLLANRVRYLGLGEIKELLRGGSVRFVVADCGHHLKWEPRGGTFAFWKGICDQIAAPEKPIFLDHFRGSEAYIASLWQSNEGDHLILLERHH